MVLLLLALHLLPMRMLMLCERVVGGLPGGTVVLHLQPGGVLVLWWVLLLIHGQELGQGHQPETPLAVVRHCKVQGALGLRQ